MVLKCTADPLAARSDSSRGQVHRGLRESEEQEGANELGVRLHSFVLKLSSGGRGAQPSSGYMLGCQENNEWRGQSPFPLVWHDLLARMG